MSSGRLRRLNRSISRSPQTNEEESDNNNNKSRGQALKLLRKKSYLNRNPKDIKKYSILLLVNNNKHVFFLVNNDIFFWAYEKI